MGKVWLIASGKGGTGKSTATAALGDGLCALGEKVCIVDGDTGLRDQDVLLGLENRVVYDMLDVANGRCELERALISHPDVEGLTLLPAAQFARAKELKPKALKTILTRLRDHFTHVIIDCPAGIEKGLRTLLTLGADEAIVLCTPDDVCIRNAERTVSLLTEKGLPRPWLIVNRLNPQLIREGDMYSAATVAQVLDCPLLGEIPEDINAARALGCHLRLMQLDCPARDALRRIARRMLDEDVPLPEIGVRRPGLFKRLFHR